MLNNLNLIYNKHIKEIDKKAKEGLSLTKDEFALLKLENALETRIQQECRNIFENCFNNQGAAFCSKRKYKSDGKYSVEKSRNLNAIINAIFVQIDNGGIANSKYSRGKKAAEGTISGFPDTMLLHNGKIVFVEFKRIGVFKISEEQQYWYEWLNNNGFKAYITNNPLFFRDVILKEF